MNFPFNSEDLVPVNYDPFGHSPVVHLVPAIEPQIEIFSACLLGGDDANRAYNESVILKLKGAFDQESMNRALQDVVKKHESLRSNFSADGNYIFIYDELPLNVFHVDLSTENDHDQETYISNYTSQNANDAYDLLNGPLFKAAIIKLSDEEHCLCLFAHHIICDGWSFGILLEDIATLYSAYITGSDPVISEPQRFSVYAAQQRNFYNGPEYQKIEEYWLQQYNQLIPVLNIPTDFPRPLQRTFKGSRLDFGISEKFSSALKKLSAKAGCSFVTSFVALFNILLHKRSGNNNFVLGLPAAGQLTSGNSRLIGHCVNLLPLNIKINPAETFFDFLLKQKSIMLDAHDNQLVTFGSLLRKLPIIKKILHYYHWSQLFLM